MRAYVSSAASPSPVVEGWRRRGAHACRGRAKRRCGRVTTHAGGGCRWPRPPVRNAEFGPPRGVRRLSENCIAEDEVSQTPAHDRRVHDQPDSAGTWPPCEGGSLHLDRRGGPVEATRPRPRDRPRRSLHLDRGGPVEAYARGSLDGGRDGLHLDRRHSRRRTTATRPSTSIVEVAPGPSCRERAPRPRLRGPKARDAPVPRSYQLPRTRASSCVRCAN